MDCFGSNIFWTLSNFDKNNNNNNNNNHNHNSMGFDTIEINLGKTFLTTKKGVESSGDF